jgi:hypothetical protein
MEYNNFLTRLPSGSDYQSKIDRATEAAKTSPLAQLGAGPVPGVPGGLQQFEGGVPAPAISGDGRTREQVVEVPPKEMIGPEGEKATRPVGMKIVTKPDAGSSWTDMVQALRANYPEMGLQEYLGQKMPGLTKEFEMSPYGREPAPDPRLKRRRTRTFKAPTGPALFGRV